jgi:hypothetical protein
MQNHDDLPNTSPLHHRNLILRQAVEAARRTVCRAVAAIWRWRRVLSAWIVAFP